MNVKTKRKVSEQFLSDHRDSRCRNIFRQLKKYVDDDENYEVWYDGEVIERIDVKEMQIEVQYAVWHSFDTCFDCDGWEGKDSDAVNKWFEENLRVFRKQHVKVIIESNGKIQLEG